MQDFLFFLGRFHVLALHLPIGIILAAVVLDALAARPRHAKLAEASAFLWGAAALSAVLTVALGYMHFAEGGFSGRSATAHRLYGTSVAVAAVAVWWLAARRPQVFKRLRTAAGVLLIALVTLTGHYGGNLTHGSTFLVECAPAPLRALFGVEERRPAVTDLAMADPYLDLVAPLLEQRCGSCHNGDKRSGEYSIATYESTLAGGENVIAIVPGNLNASELHRRVTLPPDDEAFMPAEGKTPLTSEQIAILAWWIEAGAPRGTALGMLEIEPAVMGLIAAELDLAPGRGGPAAASAGAPASADPAVVARLYEAGFLARQVSQSDPRLIVSVYSPGREIGAAQLGTLLSAAEHVVELNLQDAGLRDAQVRELGRLPALTHLRLSGNAVTDAALAPLAQMPQLQVLNLYGNAGISDAGLEALAASRSLRKVYLWGTGVTPNAAERVRRARPQLQIETGTAGALSGAAQ